MIIDSHQHFWNYDADRLNWITEQMNVLKRDFLPPDLEGLYRSHGIGGSIAVQAEQSEVETNFLLQLAEQHPFILGVVGWVDLRSEHLEERLAHFSQFEKLCGFRHVVQDEPDTNFMLEKSFQRGIALLEKYDFTYDILIYPHQLDAAIELVSNFPGQKFVVDHLAKPRIKDGEIDEWTSRIRQIAEYQNTWCKVSGIITEADWSDWNYEQIEPYLDVVYDNFGHNRLLYGSDWPVCLLAGTYGEVLGIVQQYTENWPREAKGKIFAQNAIDFYSIDI